MRRYNVLFDRQQNRWSVICRNDYEDYWFVLMPDAGSEEVARQIVDSFNPVQSHY